MSAASAIPNPAAARSRRVTGLLLLVVAMSLVDLAVTLAYMTGVGMFEANPLVRLIASATGSPAAIAAFKLLTVAIATLLVHVARRHRAGECAAWAMVLVLACVCVQWALYSHGLDGADAIMLAEAMAIESGAGWVRL